jgi:hypothetical protein
MARYRIIPWAWRLPNDPVGPEYGPTGALWRRGYRILEPRPLDTLRVELDQASEEEVRAWTLEKGITLPFWLPTQHGESLLVDSDE